MTTLRRAAVIAFCIHLIAGLSMLFVLRQGLETISELRDRFAFLIHHRTLWTLGWFSWTLAALAILYFYFIFADVHFGSWRSFALLLTVAALGPDLSAQAIEIGVLPSLASRAFNSNATPELFLTMHRVAVMLSGFLANGLYSTTALILTWGARGAYPPWVSIIGIAVGIFGIALSVAALLDSVAGMFWANLFLLPAILLWLAAVAIVSHSTEKY